MTASTPQVRVAIPGDLVIWSEVELSGGPVPTGDATTKSGRSLFGRFGAFAAPIFAAASFIAPPPPSMLRRFYSNGETSSSGLIELQWDVDDLWVYSRARTTQAEIDALNALLNLDVSEGRSAYLGDDS